VPKLLQTLLPGDKIKITIVLISKDKAHEIIVVVIINVEGSFEVDAVHFMRSFMSKEENQNAQKRDSLFSQLIRMPICIFINN